MTLTNSNRAGLKIRRSRCSLHLAWFSNDGPDSGCLLTIRTHLVPRAALICLVQGGKNRTRWIQAPLQVEELRRASCGTENMSLNAILLNGSADYRSEGSRGWLGQWRACRGFAGQRPGSDRRWRRAGDRTATHWPSPAGVTWLPSCPAPRLSLLPLSLSNSERSVSHSPIPCGFPWPLATRKVISLPADSSSSSPLHIWPLITCCSPAIFGSFIHQRIFAKHCSVPSTDLVVGDPAVGRTGRSLLLAHRLVGEAEGEAI